MKKLLFLTSILSFAALIAGAQMPVPPPNEKGFVQLNNLIVRSVSSGNPPAEVVADFAVPLPMLGSAAGTAGSNAVAPKCYKFQDKNVLRGIAIDCPAPLASSSAPLVSPETGSSSNSAIFPLRQYSYRIEITADTRLLLRDRNEANLSDFTPGDQINVFGFYNGDGTIQAVLMRNLSKPVERRFIQLNNVELVSVSQLTPPADLVVVQRQIYPCYDYGKEGNAKRDFPCPLGIRSLSDNPVTKNLQAPKSLMPIWDTLRKYVVKVDSQTVLLDRARNRIGLADLKIGDKLNVYGSAIGNSETIDADIIRDVSKPLAASAIQGTVTQINPDGSFTIQTEDGRLVTAQGAIQVGATVKVSGILDELQNIISQISEMTVKNRR